LSKGFFDNDILIKLAGCGLIDAARQQLGIDENWVLSSLKPQLDSNRGKLARYFNTWSADAQLQILGFVNKAQKLPPAKNQDFINHYLGVHNLDLGEIQLLEAAFRADDPFLITGDKRFLKQLIAIPELLNQALEKLPGRFACFESVLLLLIDAIGFEAVRDKVLPFKEIDGQIKIAFGGGASKTEEQTREALLYELQQFGPVAAPLLHYPID